MFEYSYLRSVKKGAHSRVRAPQKYDSFLLRVPLLNSQKERAPGSAPQNMSVHLERAPLMLCFLCVVV